MLNKTYQLIIRKGPNEGQEFPLTSVITTIGRDPMADITINDPELSRLHARLVETAVGYELEDLGSTNGTYVDGQLVAGAPVPLQPGQEIAMGSQVILLLVALETAVAPEATIIAPPEPEEAVEWAAAVEGEEGETAVALPDTVQEIEAVEEAEAPAAIAPDEDPMLPPAFDDLPAYPDLPEIPLPDKADFDLPDLPEFPELDEEPIIRRTPPPPRKAPPRVVPAEPGGPPPKSGGMTTKRVVGILAGVLALMICCCCGLLIFMWQWGGDWLLQQMQLIP